VSHFHDAGDPLRASRQDHGIGHEFQDKGIIGIRGQVLRICKKPDLPDEYGQLFLYSDFKQTVPM